MIKHPANSLVISVVVAATIASAQTHRAASTSAATGSVEGHVLGITRTGDLKPARMPTIHLVYNARGENLEENTADHYYQTASMAALKNRLDARLEAAKSGSVGNEDFECREDLLDIDKSLTETEQWALDNKKAKQVLTADGDEEGHFKIARVPVGVYRLVARGQAGANDAYWESIIVVKSGLVTSAKLTSPEKACSHLE